MQYLLTKQELDDLGGNAEKIRSEYQSKMDAKLGEFSREITTLIKKHSGLSAQLSMDAWRRNPELEAFCSAVKAAMDKCKLTPPDSDATHAA